MASEGLRIQELDFEAVGRTIPTPELQLTGNADGRIVTALQQLVTSLHQHLCEANATAITVDLSQLEFMNATCFNVFVTWLGLVNDLPPEKRYKLQFVTSATIPWQKRSLRTLWCFATDLVVVS